MGVIEAVEVVEEAGSRGELDNLAFIKLLAQARKKLVRHVLRITRQRFREFQ